MPDGGGFDVDVPGMRHVADLVGHASSHLDAAADSASEPPSAGAATGEVIAYLQELTHAVAGFTQSTQASGDQVRAAIADYQARDAQAGHDIGGVPFPQPGR